MRIQLDKKLALDTARKFVLVRSKHSTGEAKITDYMRLFQTGLMQEISDGINQDVFDFAVEVSLNFLGRSASPMNDLFGLSEATDFAKLYKNILALEEASIS